MTTTTEDKYDKMNIYVLKIEKIYTLILNHQMAQQIKLIQKKETLQIIRSVSPNWYDNAYSFCFTGAEPEIDKIKDDGKIEGETNPDRHGPRQIGTV